MDKLLCLKFVGRDGRTANAEHQRPWQQHIYVVYGPPHGRYARFAMLAMFGASATEVRALLISCHNFGGFGSVTFASQAIPHLLTLSRLGCPLGVLYSTLLVIYVLSYVSFRDVDPHNIPVQSDSTWSPCIWDSNDASTWSSSWVIDLITANEYVVSLLMSLFASFR